ncbi:MAG: zinc ribbon domain-containing protein, partial [Eubacterium sp.]|nr:zinc ribbon domain-containing protein [Eubacterium sp.]
MAWCPKCKNEYREGITECPDCGTELVDEIQKEVEEAPVGPQPVILMKSAYRDVAEKAVKYLRYSGILSSALANGVPEEVSDEEVSDEDTSGEEEFLVIVADVELDNALDCLIDLDPGETVDEDRLYELVPDIEDRLDE